MARFGYLTLTRAPRAGGLARELTRAIAAPGPLSTRPSGRLRTQLPIPARVAQASAKKRNPTPCTRPLITKRLAMRDMECSRKDSPHEGKDHHESTKNTKIFWIFQEVTS
jgi:hypothetical protein